MGREEQTEEREVLDSIFPDEITDISDASYRVSIALDAGDDEEEEQHVAPDLELSHPPNTAKPPLLDLSEDKAALIEKIQPAIEENLGMAMIFTLVTTLKEEAETLMASRKAAAEAERERAIREEEDKENAKFLGEKVTRERFLEWRSAFRAEMKEKRRLEQEREEAEDKKRGPAVKKPEDKLTGKMLWEKGLAGRADDDVDGDDAIEKGVQELKV